MKLNTERLARKLGLNKGSRRPTTVANGSAPPLSARIGRLRKSIYNQAQDSQNLTTGDLESSFNKDLFITTKHLLDLTPDNASLRYEHGDKGLQLTPVNLPKLPFGSHVDYNEDIKFMETHLLGRDEHSPAKSKKLDEVTRQLRVLRRKT